MFRFVRTVLVPILAIAGLLASPLHADEAEQLLSDRLAAYNAIQALYKQMREANQPLQEKRDALYQLTRQLSKPVDEGEVSRARERVVQLRKELERYEQTIAMSELTEEERATKAEESKAAEAEARKQLKQAEKPWRDRMEQIEAGLRARPGSAASPVAEGDPITLAAIMSRFGLTPSVAPYDTVTQVECRGGSFTSYRWSDQAGKRGAWAHVSLRDKPSEGQHKALLKEKFPVRNSSSSSCSVWAGHFHISFVFDNKDWKGDGKPLEALAHFLDLDGLAELDATLPPSDDVKQAIEKATEGLDAE